MDINEGLKHFTLFSGLDHGFLDQLIELGEEVTLPGNEWLFREGDDAIALYLIVDGRVTLKFTLNEEKGIHGDLKTLSKGDTFGWSALVKPHVYRFGAMTDTSVKLIRLDRELLRSIMEAHPQQGFLLMQRITETMASRMHAMSEQMPEFSFRMFASTLFTGLAIATSILVALVAAAVAYSVINGNISSIGVLLFCLIFPILFFFVAQSLRKMQLAPR
jgi:CRP-like cAMP-binding protein